MDEADTQHWTELAEKYWTSLDERYSALAKDWDMLTRWYDRTKSYTANREPWAETSIEDFEKILKLASKLINSVKDYRNYGPPSPPPPPPKPPRIGKYDRLFERFQALMLKLLAHKPSELSGKKHQKKKDAMTWAECVKRVSDEIRDCHWGDRSFGDVDPYIWGFITEYRAGRWIWRGETEEEWVEWYDWCVWILNQIDDAWSAADYGEMRWEDGKEEWEPELSPMMAVFNRELILGKYGNDEKADAFFDAWFQRMRRAFRKEWVAEGNEPTPAFNHIRSRWW
ncbi:hypothetical protein [Mesorhizobium sp. B2-6-1]|uniref:hypothetical protein n=1 Tax=Mesorhizobium sp. B2-6-1 TaxID=2589916 RepID=UPI001126284A|nr:hypothetical protein [Mesorhizobium sp. B2-6-1]TPJ58654.1 hypothetical protein FJ443_25420 [Mesorhizobium sp. B2-6-1]